MFLYFMHLLQKSLSIAVTGSQAHGTRKPLIRGLFATLQTIHPRNLGIQNKIAIGVIYQTIFLPSKYKDAYSKDASPEMGHISGPMDC